MNKISSLISVLILLFITNFSLAQKKETCKSPKESSDELNIITVSKCAVKIEKKEKGSKHKNRIKVSVRGARIKRARVKRKKVTSINGIDINTTEVVLDYSKARIQTPEIIKNLSRKISAKEIAESIPLSAVKNIPVFPSCLSENKKKQLECFNSELSKHIQKYLRYPAEAISNKTEGDVWVRFIINKKGEVSNIDARGPKNGKLLEEEVEQVIARLPKFKPGLYNGKAINIKYTLPINFSLDNKQIN